MSEVIEANPQGASNSGPLSTDEAASAFKSLNLFGSDEVANPEPEQEQPTEAAADEAEVTDQNTADDADVPDEQPEENTGRHTVKINGEERKVTLDELKKGYQLEADYRVKTAQLAEQRKAIEAERAQYKQQLESFIPQLQSTLQGKWSGVDWVNLAKTDPAQYVALQAEFTQDQAKWAQAQAEQARVAQLHEAEAKAKHQEFVEEQRKIMAEKIPVFKDPEKAKTAAKEMSEYLRAQGFSADEVSSLADSRIAVQAWKAMQYDRAQKAKADAVKKAGPARQVQKPGASTANPTQLDRVSEAKNRLAKTGHVDDAVSAFKALRIFQ